MTVTDAAEFDDLIARLVDLGEALRLDESELVDGALARLADPTAGRHRRRGWLIAAAFVALVAGIVLHPDSRGALARWFGLDGVVVRIDPTLSVTTPPETFDAPGPGESTTFVVDGHEILVSAIDGSLTEILISKTVASSEQIEVVGVMGHPGLWIDGAPHEVLYQADVGDVIVERVAADTLLWHDGAVLYRVEGFGDLASAMSFVEGTWPARSVSDGS